MTQMMRIRGAGGSTSSGGGVTEDPNTLSSIATVNIVEAIGEGEIVGLVNNEYSIYLNGVALRDLTGTPNYSPFTWDTRVGTQDQTFIPGFSGTEQFNDVSTKITVSAGPIVRPIPDQYADAVRVTMTFPSLTSTTDKGEIQGTSVQYKVGIRPVGGSWTYGAVQTITGKSSGQFQDTVEMDLTQLGASVSGYEVSVTRVTPDAASDLVQNDSYWSDYVIVHKEKFTYPNTALMAIGIDSRYFSSIPDRAYHVKGRIIRVPANYDPVTRIYATTGPGTTAGAWDGTFQWAYSNNPAWCFYDMVTNTRFGLGKRLNVDDNGYSPYVDRFSLYMIGQYCDEYVPSGVGATVVGDKIIGGYNMDGTVNAQLNINSQNFEPRFTLNGVFNTPQDSYKVLQQLASAFRGMTYWAQSQVFATQDAPGGIDFIVNNSNVKDGKFAYQGTARSKRSTVVTVGWNDPSENFKLKYEYVQDLTGIAQWGVRQTDIVMFGCTSQGQARRAGLWMLYTDKYESDGVTFEASTDLAYVVPGMLGEVNDARKAGVRWGGRCLTGTTATVVQLDAPVTLTADNYVLKVKMPDGSIAESDLSLAAGTYNSITLPVAMPATPISGALWMLSSSTVASRIVRVIDRKMSSPDSYIFTCVTHNPSKYDTIEDGLELTNYSYTTLTNTSGMPVTNVVAVENSYRVTSSSPIKVTALVSWDHVDDPLQQGYMVEMQSSTSGAYDYKSGLITDNFYTFTDLGLDDYTVSVVAVNQLNKQGPVSTTTLTITGVDSTPPADVTGFTYTQDNINGTILKWTPVTDYISAYEVRKGSSWASGVMVYQSAGATYQPGALSSAAPAQFWLKAIDTSGNYSVNAVSVTVTSTAPGVVAIARSITGTTENLTWTTPTAMYPIDHFVISYGATYAGSTVLAPNVSGNSFTQALSYTGSRTYWVVAVDTAGNVGTPGSVVGGVTVPAAPTITQTYLNTNETLSWNVPASTLPVVSYQLSYGATYATSTLIAKPTTNSFNRAVDYTGNRTYWVVAVDSMGNLGTPGSLTTSVTLPGTPTASFSLASVNEYLNFTAVQGSLPIVAYNIRYGTSYAAGTVIVSNTTGNVFSRRADWGGSRTYWIAAVDCAGNVGTAVQVNAVITVPGDVQSKRIDVVDNNALIYWAVPVVGSLPIDHYEVRKGTTWAGGTVIGSNASSTFTTVFEQQSGTYQYWITAVDSAGNFGSNSSVSATINQPPDYVLRTDIMSTFSGTLTNLAVAPDGKSLMGPLNATETFAQHFTNNGYTTPAQQVTAGNVLYPNPSQTTASYDETIDYGATLSSSTVTVTPQVTVLEGSVTTSCQIYVKLNSGDAWTAAPAGNLSYLATNFRYVRVVISFSSTAGANLALLNSLEIKLSSKRVSDGGSGTITNATTGLVVTFSTPFIQANTPVVQPTGTTPLIPVVDFSGVAYPTTFTVYLYTLAGAKTTGSFSWACTGF